MDSHEKLKLSGIEEWVNNIKNEDRKKEILEDFFSEDFVDFYGKELGVYEFQESLGLCGILLPSGHFLKCRDCQHNLLSSLLNTEEQFLSIYFSSRLFKDDMSVFSHHLNNNGSKHDSSFARERFLINLNISKDLSNFNNKTIVTQSQIKFLEKNYKYLNKSQKEMISTAFFRMGKLSENFSIDLVDSNYLIISDN